MELTANEAEAAEQKGKGRLYKIQGQRRQLHIHLRQYKTSVQYRTKIQRNMH